MSRRIKLKVSKVVLNDKMTSLLTSKMKVKYSLVVLKISNRNYIIKLISP